MRSSILREIETLTGVTHAIVLTHDIDFLFLQGLVLRALKAAGEPTLTVFADADRAVTSYESQASLCVGLGQRYRLVPVALPSGGRFHPKAVFLASPEEATLFVGSGNLTFGGWCDNGEIWARYRTAEGEGAAISAFKDYLTDLIKGLPISDVLAAEAELAFDPVSREWAKVLPSPDYLVGRLGGGPSLLERFGDRLRSQRLTVCSPFFDPAGEALRRLIESSGASQVDVLTQESSTNLLPDAIASWPSNVRTAPSDYIHINEKGERRRARLHAKWILAANDDGRAVAVVGSANCSRAALTAGGTSGNAELVVVVEGDADDLFTKLSAEIEIHSRPIVLPESPPDHEQDDEGRKMEPIVLAARLDMGTLRVAVSAGADFVAHRIEADGLPLPTKRGVSGELVAYPDGVPHRVRVAGLRGGDPWTTAESWVDVEVLLRGTAGRRRLIDLVRQSQSAGLWNVDIWADLVDAAFEEIASPTARTAGGIRAPKEDRTAKTWHEDDVFLSTFSLPKNQEGGGGSDTDVVNSTLALLFNWSQGEEGFDRLDTVDEDDDSGDNGVVVEADPGEDVEVPVPKPPNRRDVPPEKARKRQGRAMAVLRKMLDTLANPEFLGTRSPADIRRAFIMLALLLRTGRQNGWISGAEFFTVTQRAWRAVFFSGHASETRGELAARLDREDDPNAFGQALATPRLAAALAAWALAAHREGSGRELACFDLTCAVSAAHHPWMWRGAPLDRVAQELHRLIRHTYQPDEVALVDDWWPMVQRRGAALAALERVLVGASTKDLRDRLDSWQVHPGALLWQGPAGWCVSEQSAASSSPDVTVAVRKLQGDESCRDFKAEFLIPLGSLVDAVGEQLPHPVRDEIGALIRETAQAYGA